MLWDGIVVGAGPAGSVAAWLLARAGARVLVLEAARFPRDKVCGEAWSPPAGALLRRIGLGAVIAALPQAALRGMRIFSPAGRMVQGCYGGALRGAGMRRWHLDAALAQAARGAGAELRDGQRVSAAHEGASGLNLTVVDSTGRATVERGRVVLGAEGRRTLLGRRLGDLRYDRRYRRWAIRGHFEGVAGVEDFGEMHVGVPGYVGLCPLGDGLANVCLVIERDRWRKGLALEPMFRSALAQFPLLAARMADARPLGPLASVGPLAFGVRHPRRAPALLAGDALGFFDPFTGEGGYRALRSAELAAQALAGARAGAPWSRTRRRYLGQVRRAFAAKELFQRGLQRLVFPAPRAERVARALQRFPGAADRLVQVAADLRPLRRLLV